MELDFQNLSVIEKHVRDFFPEYEPYLPSVYQLEEATLTELYGLKERPGMNSSDEQNLAFNRLKNIIELECLLHIPDIDQPSPDVVGLFDERNILLEKWRRANRMRLIDLMAIEHNCCYNWREWWYGKNDYLNDPQNLKKIIDIIMLGYRVWCEYQNTNLHINFQVKSQSSNSHSNGLRPLAHFPAESYRFLFLLGLQRNFATNEGNVNIAACRVWIQYINDILGRRMQIGESGNLS